MPIIDYLNRVTLIQDENEIGEKVSVELGTLGGDYPLNGLFTVPVAGYDRQFFVSGKTRELRQNGPIQEWVTTLQGTSRLAEAMKKAPMKTQVFLTLTKKEYIDFEEEIEGDYASLDYVPLIRLGNEYGEQGWTASLIASAISQILSIPVTWNSSNFDVKEFRIDPTQSYLSALLALTGASNPVVYYLGGRIFVAESIERVQPPSVLSLAGQPVRQVREEITRNDKPSQTRLPGNLSKFVKNRFKGKLSAQPSQQYQFAVGGWITKNWAFGTTEDTATADTGDVPFGEARFGDDKLLDPDSGLMPNYTQEKFIKVTGLDIFGKKGYVLSETRTVNMWSKSPLPGGLPEAIPFSVTKTAYQYQATDPKYLRPREWGNTVGEDWGNSPGRISSLSQYVWQMQDGEVVFANYDGLEGTEVYYLYEKTGELVSQNTIKTALCYSDDGLPDTDQKKEWKPAKNLKKDDVDASGVFKAMVVENERLNYEQINRDSYKAERTVLSLGKEGRMESHPTDVQIVQAGNVQGSEENLRRLQAYAESGAPQTGTPGHMTAVMDVPAQEFSVNTPSWEALERMLSGFLDRLHAGEITRTYEVYGEWNLYPGLAVSADAWQNQEGEYLIAPGLTTPYMIITGFEITRQGGRSITRFTARGRLN